MGVNDAREQLEVAKAEVVRLEAKVAEIRNARIQERGVLVDAINAARAERDSLARLHEVATERTVQLAAVIEAAREVASRYAWSGLRYALENTHNGPFAAADTSSALAEIRAKAWDEGFNAALREVARRQGKSPVVPRRNPHREEATE